MTASPKRHYSGHHKSTEEEGDQGILEKESLRKICTSTAGGRWTRQHKTDGDKWSVAYVQPGVTRYKASKSKSSRPKQCNEIIDVKNIEL